MGEDLATGVRAAEAAVSGHEDVVQRVQNTVAKLANWQEALEGTRKRSWDGVSALLGQTAGLLSGQRDHFY